MTSITWLYRRLRCRPIEVESFFKVLRWHVTSCQMITGSSLFFFKIHTKYVVSMSLWPCTIKILISNWTQSRKFSKLVKNTGGEDLFLPWSRSPSNFYALIDQNLAAEFLRKTYAASWNLFALTAEADRVLCQLVTFLTVFFHWMYKMKYSCYQESRGFAYWFFGWEISRLSKSEIRFRMASFSLFTLLDA